MHIGGRTYVCLFVCNSVLAHKHMAHSINKIHIIKI